MSVLPVDMVAVVVALVLVDLDAPLEREGLEPRADLLASLGLECRDDLWH